MAVKSPIEEFQPDSRLIDERGSTPERKAKAGEGVFRAEGREHMRDSPINMALSRKQITAQEFTAASKLYAHWFRGGLVENFGSADMNRVFGTGTRDGLARTEAQVFHREQYARAMKLVGKRGAWTLERVVCRELPFADVGRQMGWGNRPQAVAAAIQVMRDALGILCVEWGIDP